MRKTYGPRGFVTIATGNSHYYKLAANLVRSYRLNSDQSAPFAIIAEEENEYTKEFDHVIRILDPSHNYLDKLRLFEYLPYEETIFIDADCLVYGNINLWWNAFSAGDDVSFFGYAFEDLSTDRGWFMTDGMKEFKDRIHFVPCGSSGICYIRNTETAANVFETAMYAAAHYNEYAFNLFKQPADEPVLALGMAVNDCHPTDLYEVGIYSRQSKQLTDILKPSATERRNGKDTAVKVVHWGNPSTRRSQYLFEVSRLNRYLSKGSEESFVYSVLYGHKALQYMYCIYDIIADVKGLNRRIRRKLKSH